jgi:hypothetical protein
MDTELKDLIEKQEQLRAMRQSCADFEKNLNEKIGEFCEKHLGFNKDQNFSLLDVIAKVSTL